MFKKKHFSAYNDFKTGLFYKISLLLGGILLCIFIFLKTISFFIKKDNTSIFQSIYNFSQSNSTDSIIALSILFLFIGLILYFFHRQFSKLAEIAQEIENKSEK